MEMIESIGRKIGNYASLVKFSHTIFAMPFAFIGYFTAIMEGYEFRWKLLLLVLMCMVFARSAAMAFNRYIDKDIDIKNPRTASREIPAGIIRPTASLVFVILNILAFICTTWFINSICFYLSPVALIVILGYSYTKRFTALCHLVLGLGLSLAPIGAYLSVTGAFAWLPLLYSFTVLFWVSGFDIIYALQDEGFDKSQKLKSLPVYLGAKNALRLSEGLHFLSACLVVAAGMLSSGGIFYWIGAMIFSSLLLYQHKLVKPDDLRKVNLAFMTTNGYASILFAICVLLDIALAHFRF
jgi:4-hydroxybenzoate polyprenyltransferase